jgi:acyl-coenzyme A synthetase/AMP-(fatty) acid ligase
MTKELLAAARARGVGEILVPREILVVDKVPLLPTGKVNYPDVAALAAARSEKRGDEMDGQEAA